MKSKINKEVYDRIIVERNELANKIDKLRDFIDTNPAFLTLEMNQKLLLTAQQSAMSTYYYILNARLEMLKIE